MTLKTHRRHRLTKIKAAAKLAFIFGIGAAVCGLVIYICSTIMLCPP